MISCVRFIRYMKPLLSSCLFLVTESGLKFLFDVKTTLNISDMTFYPSQTTHGYDLYASAVDKEDILFLNLVTGRTIQANLLVK